MREKQWDAYIYGDVNVDLVIPGVERFPLPGQEDVVAVMNTFVGGGAALFAMGLGKLGMRPVFQGIIGDDFYGRFLLEEIEKKNIDGSLITISSKNKTGISISFTNEKDRSFLTYRGTFDELDIDYIQLEQVQKARHIHMTGYAGRSNHEKYVKLLKTIAGMENISVSLDVGWDSSGEWYDGIYELFPYIDVLFMNETEAQHYGRTPDAMEAISRFSELSRIAVAKLGRNGAAACSKGIVYKAEPYKVVPVDTTGAGDSFNAGFIYGFLNGKTISECLKLGNACGALTVTAYGGNTGFPSEKQLKDFLKKQNEIRA